MYKGKKLSFVTPCYNEEVGVKTVLQSIPDFFDETIVVNNASTDNSAEVAAENGAKVIYEPKRGYGYALKAGFSSAIGEIIITCDSDATYPIKYVHLPLDTFIDGNYDFISCRRFPLIVDSGMGLRNKIGNKFLTFVLNLLFGTNLYDGQSGMWIFKRSILKKLELISNGMSLTEEIKIEALSRPELKCGEVPIIFCTNRIGQSKLMPWRDGWKMLLFLFKKKIMQIRKANKPKDR